MIVLSFPLYVPEGIFLPPSTVSFHTNSLPTSNEPVEVYHYVGNLVTDRTDYFYKHSTISLDRNYYLGNYDNEIEIEFSDIVEANDMLLLLDIKELELNKVGKYSRFINRRRVT